VTILQLALTFFIVTNPIGNCPTIIALIKDHPIKQQQRILFRESLFALILAVFFLFFGEVFLNYLNIANYALKISGGVLLFVVALKMIFSDRSETSNQAPAEDPFVVPIATPLLAGAGLFATIMTFSAQESNDSKLFFGLLLAWVGITAILIAAPYLQVFLGKRGLSALEQLMGMLLAMIGIEMMVSGSMLFLQVLTGI
jgi:multiple antibiotic resistance protein